MLNTIVAESVDAMSDKLEAALAKGASLDDAVIEVVREAYVAAQARRSSAATTTRRSGTPRRPDRGLSNLTTTPDALPAMIAEPTVEAFGKYGVLSERELESRYEVLIEQYAIGLNIEAETAAAIARTMILPAAIRHLNELKLADIDTLVNETSDLIDELVDAIFALEEANAEHPHADDALDHAKYMRDTVIPAMLAVRGVADKLEKIVADDLWPLPKYEEMLFIK